MALTTLTKIGKGITSFFKAKGATHGRELSDRFSDVINIKDYGGDLSGFQHVLKNGNRVFVPRGSYIVSGSLVENVYESGVQVVGDSKESSTLLTSKSDTLLPCNTDLYIKDLSLISDVDRSSSIGGRGLSTTENALLGYSKNYDTHLRGFRIGQFIRNSVNLSFKDLNWRDNDCHIMLARNPLSGTLNNPDSTGGWNQADGRGFFQNIISFDSCNFSYGEVGIFGTVLCGVFDNVSCQAQRLSDNPDNQIVPDRIPTAISLQGGVTGSTRGAGANSIRGFYSEATKRGFRLQDQGFTEISTSFMQGGSHSDPATFLYSNNSQVLLHGNLLYDWFSKSTVVNNSKIISQSNTVGAGGGFLKDASSDVRLRGYADEHKREYYITHPNQNPNTKYIIPFNLRVSEFGSITLGAFKDGTSNFVEEYVVFNRGGAIVVESKTSGTGTRGWSLIVEGSTFKLNVTSNSPIQFWILTESKGGEEISGLRNTLTKEI